MLSNFSVTSKPATPIKNYYNNSTKNKPCNFGAGTTNATEEKNSDKTIMYVGAALALAALVAGVIYLCRKGNAKDAEKAVGEVANAADKGKTKDAEKAVGEVTNAVDKGKKAENATNEATKTAQQGEGGAANKATDAEQKSAPPVESPNAGQETTASVTKNGSEATKTETASKQDLTTDVQPQETKEAEQVAKEATTEAGAETNEKFGNKNISNDGESTRVTNHSVSAEYPWDDTKSINTSSREYDWE